MKLNGLWDYRNRKDLRLTELVDISNDLIGEVAPKQPSDRVTETINERILRYYMAQGLVDRPLGRKGAAALYGYRHLLQILAIKALQGSYLPIKHIRSVLADKSDKDLERILERFSKGPVIYPGRRLRELEGEKEHRRLGKSRQAASAKTGPQTGSSWERFTLLDGIELHIRSDRKGSLQTSKTRRMLERVLESLKKR